jgi:LPXTG-motif cell wall-anchored protein
MKKIRIISFILCMMIGVVLLTSTVLAGFEVQEGQDFSKIQKLNKFKYDIHGGRYIVVNGKITGYEYLKDTNSEHIKYKGWKVIFKYKLDYKSDFDKIKLLNRQKPFKPNTFKKLDKKWLYTPHNWSFTEPCTTTATTTPDTTTTTTPDVTPDVTPDTTVDTTTDTTPDVTPTVSPDVSPDTTSNNLPEELPKTGETDTKVYIIFGVLAILAGIAVMIFFKNRKL